MSEEFTIPKEVVSISRFLGYFAAVRSYSIIDKMMRPFGFSDVLSVINDALRIGKVVYDSATPKKLTLEDGRVIEVRYSKTKIGGKELSVEVPPLPDSNTINSFLELCKEDLNFARIAAALALTWSGRLLKEMKGSEGGT
ncbi:MAG: hypothetical protein ACTSR0_03540 [Candidatus Asgardarchaeia archaeon]